MILFGRYYKTTVVLSCNYNSFSYCFAFYVRMILFRRHYMTTVEMSCNNNPNGVMFDLHSRLV